MIYFVAEAFCFHILRLFMESPAEDNHPEMQLVCIFMFYLTVSQYHFHLQISQKSKNALFYRALKKHKLKPVDCFNLCFLFLYQFYYCFFCSVSSTRSYFDDSCVSTISVFVFWSYFFK